MTNQKRFYVNFSVEGRLPFPLDMLRYDQCIPVGSVDADAMRTSIDRDEPGTTHRVWLFTWASHRSWEPTNGRWESFGWKVIPGTVKYVA